MALTTADESRLDNYRFIDLFNDKKKKKIWTTMAKEAYKYTQGTQSDKPAGPAGAKMPPKRDDVAPHLALALEVSQDFNNSGKPVSDGIPVGIAAVKFQSVLERLVRQRTQQLRQQGVRLVD